MSNTAVFSHGRFGSRFSALLLVFLFIIAAPAAQASQYLFTFTVGDVMALLPTNPTIATNTNAFYAIDLLIPTGSTYVSSTAPATDNWTSSVLDPSNPPYPTSPFPFPPQSTMPYVRFVANSVGGWVYMFTTNNAFSGITLPSNMPYANSQIAIMQNSDSFQLALNSPSSSVSLSGLAESVYTYSGFDKTENFAFTLNLNGGDVPEPAATWLVGCGLLGLAWLGARRRFPRP